MPPDEEVELSAYECGDVGFFDPDESVETLSKERERSSGEVAC